MLVQLPFPYEEGADDDAEECLQDLIRQLDPCIGRRTVDIGTAKGIADDHDDGADEDWLRSIVEDELVPLLEEYWFDVPETARKWAIRLRAAVA